MKIVVIGGSGFIGSKLVNELRRFDHTVIAASSNAADYSNAENFRKCSTVRRW